MVTAFVRKRQVPVRVPGRVRPTLACELVQIAKELPAGLAAQQQAMLNMADKFEPALRRTLTVAINQATSRADLAALTTALATGDQATIAAACGLDHFDTGLGDLRDQMLQAFMDAGATMADLISSGAAGLPIAVKFDPMNPASVAAASNASDGLYSRITLIGQETRDAIHAIVARQVAAGANPAVAARQIVQVVGLNAPQAVALANYRAALEAGNLGAAQGYSIGGSAAKVIGTAGKKGGLSPDQIEKLVESYRQRLLRMRASTIARTESMHAVAVGNEQAWGQAVAAIGGEANHFRRFWVSTNDQRTRPDHVELPEINADGVGMDEPFKLPSGSPIMRPHDPKAPARETINCRCCTVTRYEPPGVDLPPVLAGRSVLPGKKK